MQTTVNYPKISVIRPQGCLNVTNALEFERDLTQQLVQHKVSVLVIDLGLVELLDSTGLMALISGLKLAQSVGSHFRLCSVSPAIRMIFEVTQLESVFEISEGDILVA
ncbi:STAS domain-containing protein [Calothrix sp. 336/3]|uniref:STAS domain-containing protein n=1 Tax=Calothrix sp. 336/3 TaxID=1337936 RepID=UPI0004E2E8D3|nr:STAS domain-containing protein [Calothrix sp. 336/3]AKG23108.1 anti-sigma-factor antagonist [Calothrix sp. 336/3]